MKIFRYITKSVLVSVLLLGMTSCSDDFLEVVPKGKLIANKTSDYFNLLSGGPLKGYYSQAAVKLGDDVIMLESVIASTNPVDVNLFNWTDIIYEPDATAVEYLQHTKSIYHLNSIINNVMDSKLGTEEEKKAILAEARAHRAWSNFRLVNWYGKPYNQETSSTDLGFPIILTADVTLNSFTRPTVQEQYDFIVEELTASIPDLPDFVHRTRFCKGAGKHILAKIYMFMGRFDEALPLLIQAKVELGEGTELQPVGLYDYNELFTYIGNFGPNFGYAPYRKDSFVEKRFSSSLAFVSDFMLCSPELYNLYHPNDARLKLYSPSAYRSSVPYINGFHRRKGLSQIHMDFNVPELYLLTAECYARKGLLTEAVDYLEVFLKHRLPEEDAIVPAEAKADKVSLVKFIFEERRREFAFSGARWFDMRRLSVDPMVELKVPASAYARTIYNAEGNPTEGATLRPERFTLQLPLRLINENPEMIQNQ